MRLVCDLMERMVLDTDSPARLRQARAYFSRWSSEWPEHVAFRNVVVALDERLNYLGREPAPVLISSRAKDITDELELPGAVHALMLEFLSEAEALLIADGFSQEETYSSMVQAAWEYVTLVLEAGARRQIQ